MGHEITAYKVSDTSHANVLAYLIRGAFSQFNGAIYQALDAEDCNGHFSGLGVERTFTVEQLRAGLARLPQGEYERERFFLENCINKSDGEAVVISFY